MERAEDGQVGTLRHGGSVHGSFGGGDHGMQHADVTKDRHRGGGNKKAYPLQGGKQPVCPNINV